MAILWPNIYFLIFGHSMLLLVYTALLLLLGLALALGIGHLALVLAFGIGFGFRFDIFQLRVSSRRRFTDKPVQSWANAAHTPGEQTERLAI